MNEPIVIYDKIEEIRAYSLKHPSSVAYFDLDGLRHISKPELKFIINRAIINNLNACGLAINRLDGKDIPAVLEVLDKAIEDIYNVNYEFHVEFEK
jgi:hypothetical protein